ncbi:MAG: hypothetical protein PHQ00_00050 [Phycisphaerae bacterium]|nr:hypothetical protein [Phycisphaerae bacterium]
MSDDNNQTQELTFTNEKLNTPEAKQVFSKFKSHDDVAVSYMELQKQTGRPYKLPESLDKLPDDKVRGEFIDGIKKLNIADKLSVSINPETDLKDFNWTVGMEEGSKADENMQKAFTKFMVDNKLSKAIGQKGVEFWNQIQEQAKQQIAAADQKAREDCNAALIKDFNGEENVKLHSELVKRMFKDHCGLTAEEYEQAGLELSETIAKNPVLAKALMRKAKETVKTDTTENGGGAGSVTTEKEVTIVEQLPKTAQALGWAK